MLGSTPSKEWSLNFEGKLPSHLLLTCHSIVQYTLSLLPPSRLESVLILKGGIARALTQAFNFGIAVPFMMALTFIVYTAVGGELTPRRVFTTLSLIGFLRRSSIAFIVRCFYLVYEAKVALVRIQVSSGCGVLGHQVTSRSYADTS